MDTLHSSPLGKTTQYSKYYDPTLLFKISRQEKRKELGIDNINLPFFGIDIWNAYEISWLNDKGKPIVAIGEFYVSADSEFIIESKSLKLYLNSMNNTQYSSIEKVSDIITSDLSNLINSKVEVKLYLLSELVTDIRNFQGVNIDNLDITCTRYNTADRNILKLEEKYVEEALNSNLLKSNCLITNQPDWASILIKYKGKKINHESLLEYLISFREHNEFHEQCVERIYNDIYNMAKPEFLSVYARYTRRGGIDICPYRSSCLMEKWPDNSRMVRQ